MVRFTLEQIVSATQAEILKTEQTEFAGIFTDTRKIVSGSVFVALRGEKFDGHDFIAQAIERGAAAIVVSCDFSGAELHTYPVTVFQVTDTLKAYQDLAHAWRLRFSLPVVAITGSNGKTTTKDLTAAVLRGRWQVLKTEANFNNEIGLPLTLLQLTENHQAAVVEMGMRGFGQITELAEIACPTVGIVTNVGETHMELLGSLENIAKAKAELPQAIAEDGIVILNADNVYTAQMQTSTKARVLTFGLAQPADVMADDIISAEGKTLFTCHLPDGKSAPFSLPMIGRHNLYNVLAAIAAGYALGLSCEEMQQGLQDFESTKMRFEYKKVKEYHVINDAYNASPMSMAAAIDTLTEMAGGRRIAVLGDMLELGQVSAEAHANVGKKLAEKQMDAAVTYGTMAALIAKTAAAEGVPFVRHCASREEAAAVLRSYLQPGDSILFKGSRGMQMEKIIDLL